MNRSIASNHYKFTAKERDSETGLDYFGARYHASTMGRFMSPDPLMILKQKLVDPQQWNMYSYTRNNPLRFLDPTGMYTADCAADVKNCNKQIENFNKTLQNALKFKNADIRKAAAAYGKLGEKNGVNVSFVKQVDKDNPETTGKVTSQAGTGGFTYDAKTNTFQQATQVNIQAGLSGGRLEQTAVHEGVHIGDRAAFIGSFQQGIGPVDYSFTSNPALNITVRQSEMNAYGVQNIWRDIHGLPTLDIDDILAKPPYSNNPHIDDPLFPDIP